MITREQIKQSTSDWLGETEWKHFVTLTFNVDVSDARAKKELQIFLKRLNNALYGRRSRRKIPVAPFFEHTRGGRPHFHLLFGVSDSAKVYNFQELILSTWDKTNVTSRFHLIGDEKWFQCVESGTEMDLIRYGLKQSGRNIDTLELEFLVI